MTCESELSSFKGQSLSFRNWCYWRGISRSTGYRLLRAGEIETFLVGSRRYVSSEADERFLSARIEASRQASERGK